MQEIIDILKEDYQKALKKLTFFFQIQSLLMDKVTKNIKDLELKPSQSSSYKKSLEKLLY